MARGQLAVLLVAALCLVAVAVADDPTEGLKGVEDLTPDNFDKFVNGGKHVLVEFYAPWCGHCKRMTGEFKTLGAAILADPKLKARVVVAKVNADEHRSLGERFGVRGFPTLKWFPRGAAPSESTAVAYEGARTSDAFLKYITDKLAADKGFARVEALDALAAKAGAAAKDKLKAAIEELTKAADKLAGDEKDKGELYVKVGTKALTKGVEYFKTEKARLERMISSGSVAANKLEEMTRKAGVLEAFVGEEEVVAEE
ncbi:MAG: protein disulfide isomerase [Monoraphidium minutum]|nr:MAG: protein disulfide isomerase [Monoraphidium minutum]